MESRSCRAEPWTERRTAMALSNHEQRTLDEIERALRDGDPTFVNTVNSITSGVTG